MRCVRYGEIKLVQRASLSVCMQSNVEAAASLKIRINIFSSDRVGREQSCEI